MSNVNISIKLFFCIYLFCPVAFAAPGLIPGPPQLNARAYVLMDYNSGQVLVSENEAEKMPPASLTKILTVYVAAAELASNKLSLQDRVVVSEKAWKMPGSRMFIEVNKEVSVEELFKGIIIQSGNDASVALAEYISGTESVFAQLMNQYAHKLGMHNSNFTNSSGLPDDNHYTTAQDLAILSAALIRDFPDIYKLHAIKEYTFNKITQPNRNNLIWKDSSVDGIKTGHTDAAGYCLVASALRKDMRLISVVLGTDRMTAREQASLALLNYGFRFYETRQLYNTGKPVTAVRLWKGQQDQLNLGVLENIFITVPRGQFEHITTQYDLPEVIKAPINKGEQIGSFRIMLEEREITKGPLWASESIAEAGFIGRMKDNIRLIFH